MSPSCAYTLKFHVTPWVVAALLLRAAMPMGPMNSSLAAAMCSSQGMSETLEIPGPAPQSHCDACVIPAPAAPPTLVTHSGFVATAQAIAVSACDAPVERFALRRAQIPRAPPLA